MRRLGQVGAGLLLAGSLAAAGRPAGGTNANWLPVDPADLAMKDNAKDPGADAMILYRESMVDAQESSDDEYVRIKIFTQAGTQQADVEIPFRKGFDEIKNLEARTIRPDGTEVNYEGKPYEKVVVKVSGAKFLAKTFSLPDVTPGCIIEYRYRDQYDPSVYINSEWTVQGDLFTRLARFAIKPDKSEGAAALYFRSFRLPPGLTPQKQKNGWYALEVHDLPGVEEEAYMPPEATLRATVEFYYPKEQDPPTESDDQYWNRKAKGWNSYFDNFIDKKSLLGTEVAETVAAGDSPEAKLRKLYARVLKVRNLSMEESKSEKEERTEKLKTNGNVEDALKRGYAYARDINFAFAGLTRAAGFETAIVWLAPRNQNPFTYRLRDPDELSTTVVWVRAGAKEYYLDPGSRYYAFGLLPWEKYAAGGIRISKDGAKLVVTPDAASSASTISRRLGATMDADGTASGKLDVNFTGEEAGARRADNREEDEAGRKKDLEDEVKGWLPQGSSFEITKVANWDDVEQPIHVEGTVKVTGAGTPAGRRMLLPLEIFKVRQAKAFQSEKRSNAIWFHYPFEEIDDLRLGLPSGYRVETVPAAVEVKPGPVAYEISEAQAGGDVEVKRHLVIAVDSFTVSSYGAFRKFFGAVKAGDERQVVLESAATAKN